GAAQVSPSAKDSPGENATKQDRKDKKSKKKDKKKDDGNRFDDLPDGPAGTVLLSMSDDGTVVRGVRGTCEESGDASVEISSDSGASFEKVTPELTQVL